MDELDYDLLALQAHEERRRRILELANAGPCNRCGEPKVLEFADELCTACGHVPLCLHCSYLHYDEAVADGTYRKD